MKDAKQFLRYLMPGAVFGVQATGLVAILRPDILWSVLPGLASDKGFGSAVAGLLGSGALGFLFSVVHHEWHWRVQQDLINHTQVVRGLIASGHIRVLSSDGRGQEASLRPEAIDRQTAWSILTALWHSRLSADPIKSAEPRAASLSDTAHALGTSTVAAIAGGLTAALVVVPTSHFCPWGEPAGRFAVALAVGVCIPLVLGLAYQRTSRLAQLFIEHVFSDAMTRQAHNVTVRVNAALLGSTSLWRDLERLLLPSAQVEPAEARDSTPAVDH
jgi:hypothetical protein